MEKITASECEMCLLIMCGLPGAGKTTLCNQFVSARPPHGVLKNGTSNVPTNLLVQFDDIIPDGLYLEVNNSSTEKSSTAWKKYREEIKRNIEQFMSKLVPTTDVHIQTHPQKSATDITTEPGPATELTIRADVGQKFQDLLAKQTCGSEKEGLSGRFILVVDDNMFYRSMRFEYYQLARKYGAGFAQVFIDCPVDVALSRNKSRRHPVAVETISNMAVHLEKPDSIKASWEQFTVVLDAKKEWDEDDIQLIWSMLEEAFANPAPPFQEIDLAEQAESRKASLASVVHQADVTLRRCVAETIKKVKAEEQPSKVELRELASRLNAIKTDILHEIKQGQLGLPPLVLPDGDQGLANNNEFQETLQTVFRTRYSL